MDIMNFLHLNIPQLAYLHILSILHLIIDDLIYHCNVPVMSTQLLAYEY